MSTENNFPIIPMNAVLPQQPTAPGELLPWANSMAVAIRNLYRLIATFMTDRLGATGASLLVTSRILAASFTIPPNAGAYVPDGLEIRPGVTLEIASGGVLEV